ncbi:MAG: DUF86 domain-containing protein [Blastocatellia bacterium]
MRDDRERLLDIQEAIERIERYAVRGRAHFEQNELVQTWILHHLQILCAAARAISAGFKEQHPEIAWPQIAGMRNILVHQYFGIDLAIVWAVVERDLPVLRQHITSLSDYPLNSPD